MDAIHRWLGLSLIVFFLAIGVSGIFYWIRNKDPGGWFWVVLSAGQVGLALMAASGAVLLAMGGSRNWLHYAYGIFPALVLLVAHLFSKRFPGVEWAAFALAGLVVFGLLLRGYMTGIGV